MPRRFPDRLSPEFLALTGCVALGAAQLCACGPSGLQPGAPAGAGAAERRVVRTAHFSAEVDRLDGVEAAARKAADELGGFVASSTVSGAAQSGTLVLTVRVPDAQLDTALARLEALAAHVESRRVGAEDVSADSVDLDAQQRNLSAARDRLVALLGRAATATEALEVNRALVEVQGQLERVQGRLSLLRQNVAMATIVATYAPRATAGLLEWRPLDVARSALVALGVVAKGAANVVIVLLVFTPVWGPVVLLLGRRRRARRAA